MSANLFGTFASFPPGGTPAAGDWFKCTDSPLSAVATSASWSDAQWYYEDGPITLPSLVGFTGDNVGGLTIDSSHGYIYGAIPTGTTANHVEMYYDAIPATP